MFKVNNVLFGEISFVGVVAMIMLKLFRCFFTNGVFCRRCIVPGEVNK